MLVERIKSISSFTEIWLIGKNRDRKVIQYLETGLSVHTTFFSLEAERLLSLIRKIKEVFENHFDRTWFSVIIDGLPIDFRTVREIRELVSLHSIRPGDERAIYQGVLELNQFILHVRKFLLPVIKERLGVSSLVPHKIVRDKNQYLIRRFVVYTFPYNLDRLSILSEELENHLLLAYPFLKLA